MDNSKLEKAEMLRLELDVLNDMINNIDANTSITKLHFLQNKKDIIIQELKKIEGYGAGSTEILGTAFFGVLSLILISVGNNFFRIIGYILGFLTLLHIFDIFSKSSNHGKY